MPPKKPPRRAKLKKQPRTLKKGSGIPSTSEVEINDVEALRRELADALEQQTATSEILRMIASARTDLQSVMDTIAENAAKLCDAVDALVWRVDGNVRLVAAHYGLIPMRQIPEKG